MKKTASKKRNLPDVQEQKDNRGIEIEEVGIADLVLPLVLSDKSNGKQPVIAKVKISASLEGTKKGTHMSRFIEVMEHFKGYDFNNHTISQILGEMKTKLGAQSVFLEASFKYFIEKKSPISRQKSLMNYDCQISGRINKDDLETFLNVRVPITSVCPCSLAISKLGAHNQRGIVDLKVKTKEFIWLEDLISLVEKSGGSGEVYSLLKRSDEKYVTERMFDNPKFVEDIVRDLATRLAKNKKIIGFIIECKNFESIHNHNAYAKIIKW